MESPQKVRWSFRWPAPGIETCVALGWRGNQLWHIHIGTLPDTRAEQFGMLSTSARDQTHVPSSSGMLDVTETDTEVDALIRLPAGNKRAELHISLEDATGTNLWRNEWSEYTAGGEVRAVMGATLRVQPVSWTTPLLSGTLRGLSLIHI